MDKAMKPAHLATYHGNCHCGLFRFTLNITPLTIVWTCNCSICTRNGYLWIHPVTEKEFVIDAGEEKALHSYQFAMRGTTHLVFSPFPLPPMSSNIKWFCPECGSSVLARRRDASPDKSIRINARMLEGVDLSALEIKKFGGAEIGPKYVPQHAADEILSTKEDEISALQHFENKKTYRGNCHCGKFKFTLNIPEIKKLRTCNCSICTRNGYMWVWPVREDELIVERGEGTLSTYEFGKKDTSHMFCPSCGTSVMGKRHDVPAERSIGINARVLQDFDPAPLEKTQLRGRDLQPQYEGPKPHPTLELDAKDEGLQLYHGNCHCGAVTYTVKTKPLSTQKVMCCNCSLCLRNGDLYIYPPVTAVSLHGTENLTEYVFLHEDSLHSFCKHCGVSVLVKVTNPKEDLMPLNVRCFQDVDLESLQFQYYDGKSKGKDYIVD